MEPQPVAEQKPQVENYDSRKFVRFSIQQTVLSIWILDTGRSNTIRSLGELARLDLRMVAVSPHENDLAWWGSANRPAISCCRCGSSRLLILIRIRRKKNNTAAS